MGINYTIHCHMKPQKLCMHFVVHLRIRMHHWVKQKNVHRHTNVTLRTNFFEIHGPVYIIVKYSFVQQNLQMVLV